jgi:hypothetical protein
MGRKSGSRRIRLCRRLSICGKLVGCFLFDLDVVDPEVAGLEDVEFEAEAHFGRDGVGGFEASPLVNGVFGYDPDTFFAAECGDAAGGEGELAAGVFRPETDFVGLAGFGFWKFLEEARRSLSGKRRCANEEFEGLFSFFGVGVVEHDGIISRRFGTVERPIRWPAGFCEFEAAVDSSGWVE